MPSDNFFLIMMKDSPSLEWLRPFIGNMGILLKMLLQERENMNSKSQFDFSKRSFYLSCKFCDWRASKIALGAG